MQGLVEGAGHRPVLAHLKLKLLFAEISHLELLCVSCCLGFICPADNCDHFCVSLQPNQSVYLYLLHGAELLYSELLEPFSFLTSNLFFPFPLPILVGTYLGK